jgi:hypothetical protein
MTDIVPIPQTLPIAPFPSLGSANYNQEAYDNGTTVPLAIERVREIVQAGHTNATAAQERAVSAHASQQAAAAASGAAMDYLDQAGAHAVAASASKDSAAASALAATAALADMQRLYLGAKTAVPTLDNQGNPLQVGSCYTYTGSDPALKGWHWWDGAAWQLGVGDVGSAFISKVAGVYDSTSAMVGAPVQSMGLYAAAANAHHADWPVWTPGAAVTWVVQTYGDASSAVQKAQLSSDTGICFERSKAAGVWGAWVQNVTSRAFMERLAEQAVVGGSGASVTLDPAAASIHVLTLTAGALAVNLVAPRKLGDQVTVRIVSSGGAWPLTFGANIKLPTGAMPTYSAGQALTLVFVAMRAGFWDCYYSGVHA